MFWWDILVLLTFNYHLLVSACVMIYDTCIMIIIIILLLRYVNMTVWFKENSLVKNIFSYRTLLANIKSVQIPSAWKYLSLRVFFSNYFIFNRHTHNILLPPKYCVFQTVIWSLIYFNLFPRLLRKIVLNVCALKGQLQLKNYLFKYVYSSTFK